MIKILLSVFIVLISSMSLAHRYIHSSLEESLEVEFLYLNDKGLTKIPEEIQQITTLRSLDISNNQIEEIPS